ncbi:MAG: hypothetical protein K8R02_04465 [Anaerohalosphaeraceae bacterium]|nr:hypothetical protein [Anaerohalosphaeraceae bacterium]
MAINDYNAINPIKGLGNINSIDSVNDHNQRKKQQSGHKEKRKHKTIDQTLTDQAQQQYDSSNDDGSSIDFRA